MKVSVVIPVHNGEKYLAQAIATTRVAPEVVEAMVPFLRDYWGNPSSTYLFGRQVGEHLDQARARVAALINAEPREIVFTSCGTESNNSALYSALATQPDKRHVLNSAVEHSANMKFCDLLERQGYEVTFLPVAPDGSLDLYDGHLRARDADGQILVDRGDCSRYWELIFEEVKPWSYMKFPFLRALGPEAGWYKVGPLARVQNCDRINTPLAAAARREFLEIGGGRPVHSPLAYHWTRMIEMLFAAETIKDLLHDDDLARLPLFGTIPYVSCCKSSRAPKRSALHRISPQVCRPK